MEDPKPHTWRTVLDDLAGQIDRGECAPKSRLPSLPELRAHYGVSTSTLQKVLIVLEDRGMIESKQGKGFYVIGPRPRCKPDTG